MKNNFTVNPSRFIPFFCLFISGAASLTYELIWIRQLALVFGGTLYAISAVLCAFMVGLAIGAWAVGLFLNSRKQKSKHTTSILLYGVIEGVIGLYALFFPHGLDLLVEWYSPLATASLESGSKIYWLEFGLSTALMLPATICMGATLPLIGSWSIGNNNARLLSDVSKLYSLNTFGAVAGCLYTQTLAVKYFGISGTNLTAIGLNVLVFILCVPLQKYFSKFQSKEPRILKQKTNEEGNSVPEVGLSLLLIFIFMYSGMASLSSQILWTRVLVFPMGTTLYSFALILTAFLFGIALGSLIAEKFLGTSHRILKFLIIQLAISVSCIGILPLFENLPEWTLQADKLFYDIENKPIRTLSVRSLFAFGLMLLPTLGFGISFPLANRINLNLFGTPSKTLGNSYALNTMGALMGTILTPFVFIPFMGIRMSLFTIYSILIFLCLVAISIHFKWSRKQLATSSIITFALIYTGYHWSSPKIDTRQTGNHNLARTEINVPKSQLKLLDYKEGNFSTLSVIEDKNSGARTLYMNGFSTATVSDSIGGSAYMQAMGFVPMVLHSDPEKALVICFGTGNTTSTVSIFPQVNVDGVEIDKNVLSLAYWFSRWNKNVLKKKNVRMHIQDGRAFIRWTKTMYDVITLEPMSPIQAGTVNLYSREFYQLTENRLNKGGIMMQWLPLHLVSSEDARSIVKTFQDVFPYTSIWNSFLTRIVLLVGSKEPITPDQIRFKELMQIAEIRKAAQQIGVNSFLDFTDFFITDGELIKPYLKGASIVTDNNPILEFSSATLLPPLKWQVDETFLNFLKYRVGHYPQIRGLTESEKKRWKKNYTIRTAQRISVFSKRYNGPGVNFFNRKNYSIGLKVLKNYLNKNDNKAIKLNKTQWD